MKKNQYYKCVHNAEDWVEHNHKLMPEKMVRNLVKEKLWGSRCKKRQV